MDLDALQKDLIRDEGLRLKPYTDTVGKLTVGIGHNLTDNGLSRAAVDFIYQEDVGATLEWLDVKLPWWRSLDPVRQRVVVNMGFNLGLKLLDFVHTLTCLESGMWDAAAEGMLASLWARQVGERARRLAEMVRTGKDPV